MIIKVFLKGLPYRLTRPMFREFQAKQKELYRWEEHSKNEEIKKYLQQREVIEFIFALGIYYRYVIAPLIQTEQMFSRVSSYGVSSIKIGGRKIGSEFQQSLAKAEIHFRNILDNYGLNERFFAITEVRRIVSVLIAIDEGRTESE